MSKTITEAVSVLKENKFLSEELKNNIASSLEEYCSVKSGEEAINLDSFCNNVSKLETKKLSMFDLPVSNYRFTPKTNALVINEECYNNEETNKENIGAQIMLDLLYSNGEYTGFGIEGLQALNKGFRETLANSLRGNEQINGMPSDEYILVNEIVNATASVSMFFEAYTQNKPVEVIKFLKANNLEELNRDLEYNSTSRYNREGKSRISVIQEKLQTLIPNENSFTVFREMYDDLQHAGVTSFNDLIEQKKISNTVEFPSEESLGRVM